MADTKLKRIQLSATGFRKMPLLIGARTLILFLVSAASAIVTGFAQNSADVIVYGSTPGGFCAAIAAAREGASVILLEPTAHVGGLSTGGLSHCDSNQMRRATLMGLFDEWHTRIVKDYTDRGLPAPYDPKLKNQALWTFEPHVAMRVTMQMLKESGVTVVTEHCLTSVKKDGTRITSLVTKTGEFTAKVFVDGSYEGDLMAAAGVDWTIGREGRAEFGESYAGKQYPKGKMNISGFDEKGNLLPLMTTTDAGPDEAGDNNLMTYSFRLCLTKDPANLVPMPKPANYDPARFELARRALKAGSRVGFDLYPLPGNKLDGNNSIGGQISFGLIGGGNHWHTADEAGRRRIWEEHKQYTLEFIHFLRTDPAVPKNVRDKFADLGLCKDEFADTEHFTPALYVRESRRMNGMYMISQKDIIESPAKDDPIAISSFPIDSHDCQRVALKGGGVINEGTIMPVRVKGTGVGYAYQVPYRSVLPKPDQCTNLLVPVALSCTHVGISSLRIEGAWMVIGQGAGVAAALAAKQAVAVQDLPYPVLRERLRAQGQVLALPDVPKAKAPPGAKLDLRLQPEQGTYELHDAKRREAILQGAKIGFEVAPYLELAEIAPDRTEIQVEAKEYTSRPGTSRLGDAGTLIFREEGVGELEVGFTLPPDAMHLEMGFAFRNLGEKPVRLRKVTVTDGTFLPQQDRASLRLLAGTSGAGATKVIHSSKLGAENNLLCFFADPEAPRALVAGGLTYHDFRKYVAIDNNRLTLSAQDPVGRRVDAGSRYESADRFYLDGLTANPFEALEYYARVTEAARGIKLHYYTMPSVCMWFLAVKHFGGDTVAENSSVGAVAEMQRIADSGFLKYSPVAVRLVPDNYEQNNQQGWWDDKHWQIYGRKERCIVDHHYKVPYETTEKWARKVRELGGIPITYFQPGIRSEDYAKAFPGHMLYNQPQKLILKDGKPAIESHAIMGAIYGKLRAEGYDYTDPDFLAHWREVNLNLRRGGVQGVFYDYPDQAFAARGGQEDRYATATAAYRTLYRVVREELGKDAYLQERIGPGSDATLEFVNSVRTAGDNNVLNPEILEQAAMRWYKNRRLTNYDMDGKALLATGNGNTNRLSPLQRRAVLTMSYAVTGRLLLTESFRLFDREVLHDLSRVFPFHATPLSARPLDAFAQAAEPAGTTSSRPGVYDFPISEDWHQLVLYGRKKFQVPLSGDTAFGALGLKPGRGYHLYDFWNDAYIGMLGGDALLKQELQPDEARMLSIHAVQSHPQWISTDRHLMQGDVDLIEKPAWNAARSTLSGTSAVVGGEPYRVTLALNGTSPVGAEATDAKATITVRKRQSELADLVIETDQNKAVKWTVRFERSNP